MRGAILCALFVSAACGSSPTAPSLGPSPPPLAEGPYSVSGIVTDADHGRPIANANVALGFREDRLIAVTAADGSYSFSFSTTQPYADNLPNVLGLLVVWPPEGQGTGSAYQWMVREIPRGPSQTTQNVRLRPVRRSIVAGESVRLSIEPDSSLPFDWEYAPWEVASWGRFTVRFDRKWEWFSVSSARDGVLTVDVRQENGGSGPFLWCDLVGCPGLNNQSPVSITVHESHRYIFRMEIPSAWAPQHYVITTSLK